MNVEARNQTWVCLISKPMSITTTLNELLLSECALGDFHRKVNLG